MSDKMREALEPFAKLADDYEGYREDWAISGDVKPLTVADLRRAKVAHSRPVTAGADEIVRLINELRSDEADSVTILCDNPDFNGQPNCAVICNGDWTGYEDRRFAADTILDALSMAWVERKLPKPRKVIAESNGHHWVERFNLVCCRDCGFVRRADDQNKPCRGVVKVALRETADPAVSPHNRSITGESNG